MKKRLFFYPISCTNQQKAVPLRRRLIIRYNPCLLYIPYPLPATAVRPCSSVAGALLRHCVYSLHGGGRIAQQRISTPSSHACAARQIPVLRQQVPAALQKRTPASSAMIYIRKESVRLRSDALFLFVVCIQFLTPNS